MRSRLRTRPALLALCALACAPTRLPNEVECQDGADDDLDGAADCADSDCASHPACAGSVHACDDRVGPDVSCGRLFAGSTAGESARLSSYGCAQDRRLEGPERVLRFVAPVAGTYRVTTSAGEVAVLTDGPTGCNPGECLAQGSDVQFPAGPGAVHFLAVDAPDAVDFELEVRCPAGISGETTRRTARTTTAPPRPRAGGAVPARPRKR